MTKVSDHVASFLSKKVNHVFGLQGGAVVHLFDSFERIGPKPIYTHHEQAAGFAAVSYSRIHGYGVCVCTTGPGATNALTPLLGAWQDSIPCMFISGQTRAEHVSYNTEMRQVGTQEAPIVSLVKPITKWAEWVQKPEHINEMLADAYRVSISGRPGPVWLDIPVNWQWTNI